MAPHPVLAALRDRPAGARVVLVVEGGGMRGAVTGGMALAVHELGLGGAFDAVYGTSAGALNGMWLVSGRVEDGAQTWWDPRLVHTLIDPKRVLRGGRMVDIRTLVEERYEELSPGIFDAVLAQPTTLHPIATDVASGEAVDLRPTVHDAASLRRALRASAALPLLAGGPVRIGDRRYYDGGLSAAIPFRAALGSGATHVLVLRSRRAGDITQPPHGLGGALVGRLMHRLSPAVGQAYASRAVREGADERFLAGHDGPPTGSPAILSIRPPADSPVPSRTDRDVGRVREALEAGRAAARAALA
ncbi:patatin family protein [Patulibacter sp. SYSU D01012]|uniref:patatin-like phospholipase family protein n=1 Tax=Patulibacter sp. SYSU D01012 TaxID=2817381 RepID=UPI001B309186|nr:patatin family protein [Patulibacter sp. SYSU D01012]